MNHYFENITILLLFYFISVNCLYEDQVGKNDWRRQFVGKVKFAKFDHTTPGQRRVVLATEKNVLASLNAQTGDIIWRHILESNERGVINNIITNSNELISVSGGGIFIRKWQLMTGLLLKEVTTTLSPALHVEAKLFKGDLLLSTPSQVAWFTKAEKQLWSVNLPNADMYRYEWCYMKEHVDTDIHCVGVSVTGGQVVVVKVDKKTGAMSGQRSVASPWYKHPDTRCLMTDVGTLLCLDQPLATIHSLAVVDGNQFAAIPLPTAISKTLKTSSRLKMEVMRVKHEQFMNEIFFTITTDHSASLLSLNHNTNKLNVVKSLDKVSVVTVGSLEGRPVLINLHRVSSQEVEVTGYLLTEENQAVIIRDRVALSQENGDIEMVYPHVFSSKKAAHSVAYRLVCVSSDHSLALLSRPGSPLWLREEALSSIVSVEMLDLPVSENLASFEEEFGSKQSDVVGMFVNRLHTQLEQIKLFLERVSTNLVETPEEKRRKSVSLVRDYFSLNKVMLCVTSAAKVYALYSSTGDVVWSRYLPGVTGYRSQLVAAPDLVHRPHLHMPLIVQRTTAHFPSDPIATVLTKDKKTGHAVLFTFNPVNGRAIGGDGGVTRLPYSVSHSTLLGHIHDEHFLKPILLLDTQLKVHIYPAEMFDIVKEQIGNMYIFVCGDDLSSLKGYSLAYNRNTKSIDAGETWHLALPSGQRITHAVLKHPLEQVHSPGRVLGDRSVLYKYLNPNLAVIGTESRDKTVAVKNQDGVLDLYLVDVVTGHVVFSVRHIKSSHPLHILHSENWVIYSYWNQKHRRTDMTVVELYEGTSQHNATCFDSFHPPPDPMKMRQSYILPYQVTALASSVTEKGITHKDILVAVAGGSVLQVPKLLFDPRRPTVMTADMREEMVVPYIPELNIPSENTVNYNQSVYSIHSIHCAPAGLESTSLVLAYGLDLYYTQIHPSKMFDVLKDDFDYWLIAVVCSGLVLATFALQKLSARKQLKKAWK